MRSIILAAATSLSLLAATSAFAEGNGEPFGIPQRPILTASTVLNDTGSNGYPTFNGAGARVLSRTVASDTGSAAYPLFSAQSAIVQQTGAQAFK